MNNKTLFVVALCSIGMLNGFATPLVWTGAQSGNWDTATENWLDGEAPVQFAAGADVLFDDAAERKTVTVPSSAFVVGKVVFSNDTDYVLAGGQTSQSTSTSAGLRGVTSFEKRGTGKLAITGYHSFTGDITVVEGELTAAGTPRGDCGNARNTPFGDLRVPRTITVLTNGTLSFVSQGLSGAGNSTIPVAAAIEVHGGTINFCTNFMNTLGPIWFDDAKINYSESGGNVWRTFGFYGDVKFTGTTPYVLPYYGPQNQNSGTCGMHLGQGHVNQTKIWVDDITGDANADVTFELPIRMVDRAGMYGSSGAFEKLGPGTLRLSSNGNDFTGNVHVAEGTLMVSMGGATIGSGNSALGNPTKPHTITVEEGTTLHLTASDLQGQFYNDSKIALHVKGGTLKQNNNLVNGFGPVVLENATLSYNGHSQQNYKYSLDGGVTTNVLYQYWPSLGFNGGIAFKGTNVYNLAEVGGSTLFFGANGMSDIWVDDITGDDRIDVTFGMQIVDGALWAYQNGGFILGTNQAPRRATWRKTGPGTLKLNNGNSPFTGDVEIREGVVELCNIGAAETPTWSALGNLAVADRTITICNGATLSIPNTDTFGQLAAQTACRFVVSNGTIRLGKSTSNGLPKADLYDATFDYSGANGNYGTLAFNGTVTFDGTRPYDFQVRGDSTIFALGWTTDYRVDVTGATSSNICGKTEFCVKDITRNADIDVNMAVPLRNRQEWWNATYYKGIKFKGGVLKTGPGTFALAAESNYSEPTVVREGAFLVNARLPNSVVQVESGARLGGTGTIVQPTTIAAGGGFTAKPGQTAPLTLGSVTLPSDNRVALDIAYVGDVSEQAFYEVPVVRSAGLENAKWQLAYNGGEPPTNYRLGVRVKNGIVYGCIGRSGMTIIVR